ncbi:unnamed protein product [Hydatigera taeniaeformis]|uniref:DUF667 domain-containing protein n=1 Tax=Hydatigena taeniaeformis TaxID=6205 RepID=A0A0R3WW49_HYDTA|nr:unnamed protein product [Hydatigera taeniaeformis]
MGVEESKLAESQRHMDQFLQPCSRVTGRPWTLVHSCSLEAWRKKYSAIVHLARNLITQFGIVDLHIHKFLGTFGRQSVKYSPDSVAARISPDSSLCLIRLPWSRISRVTTLQSKYLIYGIH